MHARIEDDELIPARLQRLPAVEVSMSDGWADVERRMLRAAVAERNRRRMSTLAAAASVGALAIFLGLRFSADGGARSDVRPARVAAVAPTVDSLLELQGQSRVLEEVLAGLPERPAVARAGTALPIDELQAHVQWIDHQLTVASATNEIDAASEQLWRERVATMNSLVQLRYLEAQRTAL